MAKPKSELKIIFEAEGYFNSEDLILENDDEGNIDLKEILNRVDSKFVKISVIATDKVDIPTIAE